MVDPRGDAGLRHPLALAGPHRHDGGAEIDVLHAAPPTEPARRRRLAERGLHRRAGEPFQHLGRRSDQSCAPHLANRPVARRDVGNGGRNLAPRPARRRRPVAGGPRRRRRRIAPAPRLLRRRPVGAAAAREVYHRTAVLRRAQAEPGQALGVTRERVRQLEVRALERLRAALLAALDPIETSYGRAGS